MKLVWVGIALLVATVSVGVGCGPKEKYCYKEMDTCAHVEGARNADAMFDAMVDADAMGTCFNSAGDPIPCG